MPHATSLEAPPDSIRSQSAILIQTFIYSINVIQIYKIMDNQYKIFIESKWIFVVSTVSADGLAPGLEYIYIYMMNIYSINSLRTRRDRRHFVDDVIKCIFFNENVLISIKISLNFIPKGPIKIFQHWFR